MWPPTPKTDLMARQIYERSDELNKTFQMSQQGRKLARESLWVTFLPLLSPTKTHSVNGFPKSSNTTKVCRLLLAVLVRVAAVGANGTLFAAGADELLAAPLSASCHKAMSAKQMR